MKRKTIPEMELPAVANGRLLECVEFAREAASYRVGYEVELACLEPVTREGRASVRLSWCRKNIGMMLAA
jgi:hypothetical protein